MPIYLNHLCSASPSATDNSNFSLGKYTIYLNVMNIHTRQKEIKIVLVNNTLPYQVFVGFFSDPPPSEAVKYEDYYILTYRNIEGEMNYIKIVTVYRGYDYRWDISALESKMYSYDRDSEIYREYTDPERDNDIQSNNTFIKNLAESIANGETNPVKIAKKVYDYIVNNIQYGGGDQQDALTVLKTKKGVCEGMANAFVALLRARGIPARKVYSICHAWAEFYLPDVGWIPVDPATYQFGFVTHFTNETSSKRLYGYPTKVSDGLTITSYHMASGEHIDVFQGVNVREVDWNRTWWEAYDKSSARKYDTDDISEVNVLWEVQPMYAIHVDDKKLIPSPELLLAWIKSFINFAKNYATNTSRNTSSDKLLSLIKQAEDFMSQGKVFRATVYALQALSIDAEPPETKLIVQGSFVAENTTIYLGNNSELHLIAIDKRSAVKATYFNVDNRSWQVYEHPIKGEELSSGMHEVSFYSVDVNDNVEFVKKAKVFVDNKPPVIHLLAYPSNTIFTRRRPSTVLFLFSVTDFGIGTSEVLLNLNGRAYNLESEDGKLYSIRLNLTEGNYTWFVIARDKLNNTSTSKKFSFTLLFDQEPPKVLDINFEPRLLFEGDSIRVVANVVDEKSGVKAVRLIYAVGGKELGEVNMSLISNATYEAIIPSQKALTRLSFYIEAEDEAGNVFRSSSTALTILPPAMFIASTVIALFIVISSFYLVRKRSSKRT